MIIQGGVDVSASLLYVVMQCNEVMKNIVVECQKMCYDVKRVIVLQGGESP